MRTIAFFDLDTIAWKHVNINKPIFAKKGNLIVGMVVRMERHLDTYTLQTSTITQSGDFHTVEGLIKHFMTLGFEFVTDQ